MSKIYVASRELRDSLEEYLAKHKIKVEFADRADEAEVVIMQSDEHKKESDFDNLVASGSIMCAVGRSMANRLNIEKRQMAKILEFLKVDITDGQLDCF